MPDDYYNITVYLQNRVHKVTRVVLICFLFFPQMHRSIQLSPVKWWNLSLLISAFIALQSAGRVFPGLLSLSSSFLFTLAIGFQALFHIFSGSWKERSIKSSLNPHISKSPAHVLFPFTRSFIDFKHVFTKYNPIYQTEQWKIKMRRRQMQVFGQTTKNPISLLRTNTFCEKH